MNADKMKKTELYANAREYYFSGKYTYKEISKLTGVPERTLRNWIKEGNWHRLREDAGIAPAVILENFVSQLVEMQNNISSRPFGRRYPNAEEAEIQRKLFSCIINMNHYPTNTIAALGKGMAPVTDIVAQGEPALESEIEQLPIQEPLRSQFMPYENDNIEIMYRVAKEAPDPDVEIDYQAFMEATDIATGGREVAKSGNGTATDPDLPPDHNTTDEAPAILVPLIGKMASAILNNAANTWHGT